MQIKFYNASFLTVFQLFLFCFFSTAATFKSIQWFNTKISLCKQKCFALDKYKKLKYHKIFHFVYKSENNKKLIGNFQLYPIKRNIKLLSTLNFQTFEIFLKGKN